MIAYRIFEGLVIAAFLLYSLRQILSLFPNAAAHITRLAGILGISPRLLLPARFTATKADGCSSCNGCTGCGPTNEKGTQVITLHRNNRKA